MIDHILTKWNRIGDWVFRLAYLNTLWFLFSIIGVGFLGVFPATSSMFTILRKWLASEEVSVFQTFKETYQNEFVSANKIGWIFVLLGLFLVIDFIYLGAMEGTIYTLIIFLLIPVSFIYMSMLIYIFPVMANFQLSTIDYLKYAFIMSISFPHFTFVSILGAITIVVLFISFPLLISFFCASAFALLYLVISRWIFNRIGKRELSIS